jgi:hypothetical protein
MFVFPAFSANYLKVVSAGPQFSILAPTTGCHFAQSHIENIGRGMLPLEFSWPLIIQTRNKFAVPVLVL